MVQVYDIYTCRVMGTHYAPLDSDTHFGYQTLTRAKKVRYGVALRSRSRLVPAQAKAA